MAKKKRIKEMKMIIAASFEKKCSSLFYYLNEKGKFKEWESNKAIMLIHYFKKKIKYLLKSKF